MAYQIDRYNNTILTVVQDGTIDQTTDLKFIGRNYAGYGEMQNENFLYLLENFSGANPPPRALSGQLWFDSASSKIKFYDGNKWRTNGGSEVSDTQPTGLAEGDFWWDNVNDQLYAFNGTDFTLIGPQSAGQGVTQMLSRTVLDSSSNPQSIIEAVLQDETIYIVSATEFTLSNTNPIPGFSRIKKGLTLINTPSTGLSAGITTSDHYYWGTSSNSLKLGGKSASEYLTVDSPSFSGQVSFGDSGIAIGDSLDLKIYVENGNEGVIANETDSNSIIKFKLTNNVGTITHSTTLTANGIDPAQTETYNLGTASLKWNNVYATTFNGTATRAISLLEGTNARTASAAATPNTVAVRTSSADLVANLFQGTATQARYADLAEKYTTPNTLPIGTAVAVSKLDFYEVEAAGFHQECIGVVSENPGYMMNCEAEGQYIGLKGRVPVRVIGPVFKGSPVYTWAKGICAASPSGNLVGIALETNENINEKLVECVLKV